MDYGYPHLFLKSALSMSQKPESLLWKKEKKMIRIVHNALKGQDYKGS